MLIIQDSVSKLGRVTYAFNPSTQEAEAEGSLLVQRQPGLQSKFQDSLGYTEKTLTSKIRQREGERGRERESLLTRSLSELPALWKGGTRCKYTTAAASSRCLAACVL